MSTPTPAAAMHHSPAVWGLLGAGAAAVVVGVGTLVWNLHQHAADRGIRWLDGLRDAARI
jgi:hypothetical protein